MYAMAFSYVCRDWPTGSFKTWIHVLNKKKHTLSAHITNTSAQTKKTVSNAGTPNIRTFPFHISPCDCFPCVIFAMCAIYEVANSFSVARELPLNDAI